MSPTCGVTSACRGPLKNNRCVSTPTVRLGGDHQTRHERPSQPPAGSLGHRDFGKLTFNYSGRDFRLTDVYGEVVKEIRA
jgi:hypothetical protein